MKRRAVTLLILCAMLFLMVLSPATVSAADPVAVSAGDVNEDGAVSGKDVTVLRRFLAGGYGVSVTLPIADSVETEEDETRVIELQDGAAAKAVAPADVDGDGELTVKDVTLLRRYLVGGYGASVNLTKTYTATQVDFSTETSLYKKYGRTFIDENGLEMLWPNDAIEFTMECAGKVTLHYMTKEGVFVRVYVDGEETDRAYLAVGSVSLVLAEDLPRGEHTFRVVRDSDISKYNLAVAMRSVSFTGSKYGMTAPENKDLLIEFVGDSITSGKYTMPDEGNGSTHSATLSYAYLTAQAMDADWICTSRGGIAFIRTTENGGGSCPKTMAQCYDYVNPFAADEDLIEYDFARKADVVVLALGTNDNATGATFQDAVKAMIDQIRARNGNDVKIVVLYKMMTTSHGEDLEAAAEAKGAYFLEVTQDRNAYDNSHPSAAGHQVIAGELTAFLRTIL